MPFDHQRQLSAFLMTLLHVASVRLRGESLECLNRQNLSDRSSQKVWSSHKSSLLCFLRTTDFSFEFAEIVMFAFACLATSSLSLLMRTPSDQNISNKKKHIFIVNTIILNIKLSRVLPRSKSMNRMR